MIEENIEIHDRYQFEIKLAYKLNKEKKYNFYNVETYLFLPQNLGINKRTYKKDQFYTDIHSYIRLKTPQVPLRNMVNCKDSPFKKLKKATEKLTESKTDKNAEIWEYHTKMFLSIFRKALRDHVLFTYIKKDDEENIKQLIEEYIENIEIITKNYRGLKRLLNIPTITEDIFNTYTMGDEFLSLSIENATFELIERLKDSKEIPIKRLLLLIENEYKYRKMHNIPSIPNEKSDNETYLFRSSVLKKFISSVLFLDTRYEKEGKIAEQVFYSIAAGMAMVFATLIAFYTQKKYGGFTFPLFIALVVSYMFKDRIKELTRIYFAKKLRKLLFDHKTYIYVPGGEKIGMCKERFSFAKEKNIAPEILKIRNRDNFTNIENDLLGEHIIYYRKFIRLHQDKIEKIYREYTINGIDDIIRFNISTFLKKMDDPKKLLYILTDDGYKKIWGEKVYHINMIIKFTTEKDVRYKRFRLIITRKGLKRIEEVI
ncbi:MAG TPA: hypothetical protein EYP16_06805 [Candidatus Atribacteria bacterium]|nr:hypothetical protein [Candidatus Atribacteria bacterium]